jgi:transcriptional regulator with XRE-family HTH domain
MPPRAYNNKPLTDVLPDLIAQRGGSLRTWARRLGISPSHLSRLLRGLEDKHASPELLARICQAFDLPPDFLPEFREAAVVDAIKKDAALRDRIFRRLG